jgi:hypothetical protein
VGLNLDEEVWDVTVFTKNRERLLKGDVARSFFQLVVKEARALDLMSDEHFTVDGTLMEACASLKSFQKMEEVEEQKPKSMTPAIRRWTFMARGGTTRPSSRQVMGRRCWPRRERAKKRS